jgi:hypothetical protein
MEAVRTSETSVDNHFTRQYIPEDNSEHYISFHALYLCRINFWGSPLPIHGFLLFIRGIAHYVITNLQFLLA